MLGYSPAALATLPQEVTAAFNGIGNPLRIAPLRAGMTVVDVGCGAGLEHVEVRSGDAIALPVDTASVDVVISNGVLNLIPEKETAVREMYRVLMPAGQLLLADIALETGVSDAARRDIDLWTA